MITEDFVSFETAKLLKEKGFDELCAFQYYTYWEDGKLKNYLRPIRLDTMISNSQVIGRDNVTAPTLQMVCKWLREIHNIDIFPWKIGKGIYSCAIFNSNTGKDLSSNKDFPSEKYEKTVEAAIKYCLEHLI